MNLKYKEYSIEKANNQDILAIKNLVFKVLTEYHLPVDENGIDGDLNDVEANYHRNKVGFWVIRNENNLIVGTLALGKHSKEIAEIRKLYFSKEIRGKGLGEFCMNFLIGKAKEWNYKAVALETARTMQEAIGLYQKLGFKPENDFPMAFRCDQAYRLDL